MIYKTAGQAAVFLATIYAGLALGLAYDALSAVRAVLRRTRLITALCDCAFWAAALVACVITAVSVNGGAFYGYMLLGHLCGFLIYRVTLSRVLAAAARCALIPLKKLHLAFMATALGKKLGK